MNPSAVQYLIPVPLDHLGAVRTILTTCRWQPRDELEGKIHFASVVLFPPDPQNDDEGHLLSIEACADVLAGQVSAVLVGHSTLKDALGQLYEELTSTAGQNLTQWLEAHRVPFATVGTEATGLPFNGTPGMSVLRIHKEAKFADFVRQRVRAEAQTTSSPLALLLKVRTETFQLPQWKDMLIAEPTQLLAPARSLKGLWLTVALAALRDRLWLLLFVPLFAVLVGLFFWDWIPHPDALRLSPVNLPSVALVVVGSLVGMALLEAMRLRGLNLAWLLLASAATPALWLAVLWAGPLVGGTEAEAVCLSLARVVAVLGLASGVVLAWRSLASWRLQAVAVLLLCPMAWLSAQPMAAGTWPSGLMTLLGQAMAWLYLVLLWLCSAAMLLLCLLALAWMLRSSATAISQRLPRMAVVATLGILATHMALHPNEALWLVMMAIAALCIEVLVLLAVALVGFQQLRDQEEADRPLDREPDAQRMAEILAHEDQVGVVQNHLAAQSIVKPGWFRLRALKLALWLVQQVIIATSPAGFLDRIGTIHHARWMLVPGTRRLLFLSNYDGSWQSYLEDFIARIRRGMTTIWSNTTGFPRSFHLTDGGASDGGRFKRWARRQQVPSSLWFSAYPKLTTSSIRTNAAIRLDLLAAQTEREAVRWLEGMGEAVGLALNPDRISSLVLGGVGKLPHAALMALSFPNPAEAQAFVRHWRVKLAYGRTQTDSALSIAFSHEGLKLLNLPEPVRAMLPESFRSGMSNEYRARKLGDPASADSRHQWNDTNVHAVMLIHADLGVTLSNTLSALKVDCEGRRIEVLHTEKLGAAASAPLARAASVANPLDVRDGISQPRIRGLDDTLTPGDDLHAVAPGEILLGHPDNLGQSAAAPADGGPDLLRNSSFLVVRQLAFHRLAFDRYLLEEALRQLPSDTPRSGDPACVAAQQMLAAKMLGRWPSGVSLLKSPESDPGPLMDWPIPADNDFLLGRDDPQGLRCPLGAHIRRMNPRDSFEPGSQTQVAISNRHRILRVSRRFYRPAHDQQPLVEGLMFMCLNADIERQFEFLQQTWGLGANFHGLDNEVDPLLATGSGAGFSIPSGTNSRRLPPLPRLTTLLGGGYFLLPGKELLDSI